MTDKIRILHVITRADFVGGAQFHLLQLCAETIKQGHEVHVASSVGTRYPESLRKVGCVYHPVATLKNTLDPVKNLKSLLELKRLIQRIKPDLICGHSSVAGILSKVVAAHMGVPCIFTAHGWSFTEGNPALKRVLASSLERLLSGLNNRIICVSDHDRKIAVKAGISPRRLVMVHNGVPEPTVRRRTPRPPGKKFVVAMVARFAAPKRQDTLIRALPFIPDIEVRFAGNGPLENSVIELARKLKVVEKVEFLGWRDDIENVLRDVDAFCMLSDYEGFPLAILEAMRIGLPCVVSDVGGCSEAVIDGENGFLVPRGGVAVLADRLNRLIEDRRLALKMGREGLRGFKANFTLRRMVDETMRVYHETISGAGAK